MKKTTKKLLSVGLCAALALSVGCGLAACGGDDGKEPAATPKAVPYWLAGKIQATDEWNNVTDANRFTKTADANKFEITLDMWKGDNFKVRYEGKEWSQFQLNWNNSYDETQKADENAKISYDPTSISGEYNYLVKEEGNYTIKLDVGGENPVVSYVYNGEATVKAPKTVTQITLSETSKSLEVGQSFKLVATIAPDDADDKTVEWYSSEEDYATVDEEGNVTAVAPGETTITVCTPDESVEATCTVTVVAAGSLVAVESVALNKPETTLHAGQEETLVATVTPADATGTVAYTSSAPTVATVDAATGKITALKAGTATITASQGGKTATCEVTVVKDYYLRGSMMGWKPAVEVYGQQNIIYFTETETAGIYKTESVEISNNAEFQIAVVAAANDGWDGAIKNNALPEEGTTLDYFEAKGTDNILVKTSGMYTITLDLTGENPVLTVVQDQNLPDEIKTATGFGVWGDAVETTGWNGPADADKVDFTKGEDGKWTATVTGVKLLGGETAFQFRCEVDGTTKYIDARINMEGEDKKDNFDEVDGIASVVGNGADTNYTNSAAGTYSFTIVLTAAGNVESITATKTA